MSRALLAALGLAGALPAVAAQYHVDAERGSDGARGTSPASAWRTLARVSRAELRPGDAVAFRRGQTFPGTLTLRSSGTAERPIRIGAFGTGPAPVIDGRGSRDPPFGIRLTKGASHVVLEGLHVRNVENAGVALEKGSRHVEVRGCEITATGVGVLSMDAHNRITGNHVHDLRMVRDDPQPGNDFGATGVHLEGAHHNEVSHNRFVRCRAPSTDFGHDGGAIEFWRGSSDVSVHHNWVEDCEGFVEIGGRAGDVVERVTFAQNVVTRNHGPFSQLHLGGDVGVASVRDLRFEANTVAPAAGDVSPVIWFGANPPPGGVTFRNNLVLLNPGQPAAHPRRNRFSHDHNLFWRTDGSRGALGLPLDPTDVLADPRLRDPARDDLHLLPGSAAIGAGAPLGHATDFDGNPVPTSRPDIGAYQHVADGPPGAAPAR